MHILCINYCYIQKEGTIFNPSSIASLFSHFVMEGFVKYSVCNVYTFIQLLAPTKSYLTQTFTCLFCGQLSPSHIKHKLSVNESQRNKGNECHCLYDPTLSEGVYHCLLQPTVCTHVDLCPKLMFNLFNMYNNNNNNNMT